MLPPRPPSGPQLSQVSPELAQEVLIAAIRNDTSSGCSKWTAALLAPALDDPDALQALATLLSLILAGAIGGHARTVLLASQLTVIRKDNGKLRDICNGELFYKLAAAAGNAIVGEDFNAVFPTIQKGIGKRGGSQLVATSIQAHVFANPDHIACFTDFADAFGNRSRHSILSHAYAQPALEPLHHFAYWAYSEPSALLLRTADGRLETLTAARGVKKGDPLGNLLFSASVQPLYAAVQAKFPSTVCHAIVDDFSFQGPVEEVIEALHFLHGTLQRDPDGAAAGLTLNLAKCSLHCPSEAHPPAMPLRIASSQLGVPITTGLQPHLGTFIGLDADAIAEAALERVDKEHSALFRLLLSPYLPQKLAFRLLTVCALPRFDYLTRTVPPAWLAQATGWFDLKAVATAQALASIDRSEKRALALLSLPISQSGAGVRSQAIVSPAAYWASNASTAAAGALVMSTPLAAHLADSVSRLALAPARLAKLRSSHALPTSSQVGAHFIDHYAANAPVKLQKALCRAVELQRWSELRDSSTPFERAVLFSAGARGAGAWLVKTTAYSNVKFVAALRARCGLLPRGLPDVCTCGANLVDLHFLVCPRLKGCLIRRHNMLRDAATAVFTRWGFTVFVENHPFHESKSRPDHQLLFPGRPSLLLDWGICNPAAPSRVAQGAANPGAVARSMASLKEAHYAELLARDPGNDDEFIPTIFDAFGGVDARVKDAINVLFDDVAERQGWTAAQLFHREFLRCTGDAVQLGMAHVLGQGVLATRIARRRPLRSAG